jgi:hypothetical protein
MDCGKNYTRKASFLSSAAKPRRWPILVHHTFYVSVSLLIQRFGRECSLPEPSGHMFLERRYDTATFLVSKKVNRFVDRSRRARRSTFPINKNRPTLAMR